jgi:TDG/mug DNA glycosylase family protein
VAEGRGKPLRDVVGPGLDVLFCGINPSLVSAERGHHFARPGNRFWPALHLAGLTPRRFRPEEDGELLGHGLGITNVVDRPTRTAAELDPAELREGARALAELVERYRPRVLAVLGVTAWRVAFDRPRAGLGRQPERIGGAETWVAPNPSGLPPAAGPPRPAQVAAVDPVPAGTPVRCWSPATPSAVSLEWKAAGAPRS